MKCYLFITNDGNYWQSDVISEDGNTSKELKEMIKNDWKIINTQHGTYYNGNQWVSIDDI